jgi:diguanylate cyclase (GGDEF)-like protein
MEAERETVGHQAVLIVDVDRFADLVSEHGPDVGDQTMRSLASAVRGCLRHSDMLGRYGQDKLCILSYVREAWIAAELAEQLRAAVERNTVVTSSIGVAHAPARQASINTLLARADAAKAAAQGKGRNRVEVISMSMRLPVVPGESGRGA